MSQVKLEFGRLPVTEKIQKVRQVVTAMTGNGAFPTPKPALSDVTAAVNALETGYNEAQAARNSAIAKTPALRKLEDALEGLISCLVADVQSESGGDAAKIRSAAMDVRDETAPPAPMEIVTNLAATMGDESGELDAHWNPVRGARSYRVETTTDPAAQSNWTIADVVTKSSASVKNLPSGVKVWLRVAAVYATGTGPGATRQAMSFRENYSPEMKQDK